jgi:hypothetical protein
MSEQHDEVARGQAIAALLEAGLALQGLPLEPELLPRVVMHLQAAVAMADLVNGFVLPDEAEPAPVFVP